MADGSNQDLRNKNREAITVLGRREWTMPTVEQLIRELIDPVFALVGSILRPLGILGLGIVVGTVLRQAVVYKQRIRFYTPLIFLGVVILFGVLAYAPWSSAGTLAGAGIGLFIGYMMLGRKEAKAVVDDEETDSQP